MANPPKSYGPISRTPTPKGWVPAKGGGTLGPPGRISYSAGSSSHYFQPYQAYLAESVKHKLGRVMNEEQFKRAQKMSMQKYVEKPAQPMVKNLIDRGYQTVSSNYYGPGDKAVQYRKPGASTLSNPVRHQPIPPPAPRGAPSMSPMGGGGGPPRYGPNRFMR